VPLLGPESGTDGYFAASTSAGRISGGAASSSSAFAIDAAAKISPLMSAGLGSPTIRVGGRDVDPRAEHRDHYGLKCRLYQTPAGLAGLPSDEWILNSLAKRQGQ
jgi:hypothetical protein